jgi:hypothetical protein
MAGDFFTTGGYFTKRTKAHGLKLAVVNCLPIYIYYLCRLVRLHY